MTETTLHRIDNFRFYNIMHVIDQAVIWHRVFILFSKHTTFWFVKRQHTDNLRMPDRIINTELQFDFHEIIIIQRRCRTMDLNWEFWIQMSNVRFKFC